MYNARVVSIAFVILAVLLVMTAYWSSSYHLFYDSNVDRLAFWGSLFAACGCLSIGAGFEFVVGDFRRIGERVDVLSRRLDELEKKVGS